MKLVYFFPFVLIAAVSVFADVPERVVDSQRGYFDGERVQAIRDLPCDSTEGGTLAAGLTPVVLQMVPSVKRSLTIYNAGTTFVFYRASNWGLPSDWATVHGKVSAGSFRDLDLSNTNQLWTWSAVVQTPAPAYMGCYAVNAPGYIPTVTPTITPTSTSTATPTATPTPTPTP